MYKAKVGNSWVSKVVIVTESRYQIEFTSSKALSVDLDKEDIEYILKDFKDAKIFRIEYKEVNITDL